VSNFEASVEVVESTGLAHDRAPVVEILVPRPVMLGPHQEVRRVLPNRDRRMIGAWCFVDHYGPEDISGKTGMWVPPHPHSGLQTVSWLMSGEIQHRDSLGSDALIRPGELNLMTSGPGIAHSEQSPTGHSGQLHGLQLWVALPSPARHTAPRDFTQYDDLPTVELPGLTARVVTGELAGAVSSALTYSPLVGAELTLGGASTLALRPDFEYGVLGIDGDVEVEGQRVGMSEICYLGGRRDSVHLDGAGRAFLLGGEPFEEELVMWWNFIGRSHEEIVAFRHEWNEGAGERFGQVVGSGGDRLLAPPMPTVRLKPRGRGRSI
jgi:redox-sensitive bicupin YhaK (pirin superfamily)